MKKYIMYQHDGEMFQSMFDEIEQYRLLFYTVLDWKLIAQKLQNSPNYMDNYYKDKFSLFYNIKNEIEK